MISIRIVDVDYYMHYPVRDFDLFYSEFRCNEVRQVPVIEIFGSTPTGQKSCLHVHGVFPYIYIPYEGSEASDSQSYKIASELDKSINIALGQASSSTAHIHNIKLVSGIPLYGYHEKHHQFYKIYFYNPAVLKTACSLLEHGAILGKSFQPHEAHINYILQFMIDYNLHGMSYINLQRAKYRDDPENPIFRNIIPADQILPASVVRRSICAIEMDTNAIDILNQDGTALAVNPGLAALWDDEKQRRRDNQIDSQFSFSLTLERIDVKPTESHEVFNEKLVAKLLDDTSNESSLDLNKSVYPAEMPDISNVFNADTQISTSNTDDTIEKSSTHHLPINVGPALSTPLNSAAKLEETPPLTTSITDGLVDNQITADELAVLSLLEELNDAGPIEDDSILSQTTKEFDEESDEETQQLSIPLQNADIWNDSFWDENCCEVPQLDGICDTASEGFSGQDDEWADDHIGDLPEQTVIFDRSFFNTIFNMKRYELRKADDVFICKRNGEVVPSNKLLRPGVNKLITSEPCQKSAEINIISDICVTAANSSKITWSLDKSHLHRINVCVQNKSDICDRPIESENYTWCSPSTSYEDYYDEHAFSDVILNDVNLSDALGSSLESNDATEESLNIEANKENAAYKPTPKKHICSKTMKPNLRALDGATDKFDFYSNTTFSNHMRRRSAKGRCGFCSCDRAKVREQEYSFLTEEQNLSADEHSENALINTKSSIDQVVPKSKKLPTFITNKKRFLTKSSSVGNNYTVKKSQTNNWNLDGQGDTSSETNDNDDVIKSKNNTKKVNKDKTIKSNKETTKNQRARTEKDLSNKKKKSIKNINSLPTVKISSSKKSPPKTKKDKSLNNSPDKVLKPNKSSRKSPVLVETLPKTTKIKKAKTASKETSNKRDVPDTCKKSPPKQGENLPKRTSGASRQGGNGNSSKNYSNMYKQLEVRKTPKRNTNQKLQEIPEISNHNYTHVPSIKMSTQQNKPKVNVKVDQIDKVRENLQDYLKFKSNEVDKYTTLKRPNSPEPQIEASRPHKIPKDEQHSVVITINKRKSSETSIYNNLQAIQILQTNGASKTNDTTCVEKCASPTKKLIPINGAPRTKETVTFAKYITRSETVKSTNLKLNLPNTNTKQAEINELKPIQIHETVTSGKCIIQNEIRKLSTNEELKLESTNQNTKTEEETTHTYMTQPETSKFSRTTRSRVRKLAAPKANQVKPIKTVKRSKVQVFKDGIRKNRRRPRKVRPLNITEMSKIQLPDCKIVLTPIQLQSAWTTYVLGKSKTTKPITPVVFQPETNPTTCELVQQPAEKNKTLLTLIGNKTNDSCDDKHHTQTLSSALNSDKKALETKLASNKTDTKPLEDKRTSLKTGTKTRKSSKTTVPSLSVSETDIHLTHSRIRKSTQLDPSAVSSSSSSDDISEAAAVKLEKSPPRKLKGRNNKVSPLKYIPLQIMVRSPRTENEMSFAEYEPLKKRLRSSINTEINGNKSSAKPIQVPATIVSEDIKCQNRGAGELQVPPILHENKNEEVSVNCDTTNQTESIIKYKTTPRKQLKFESSNETLSEIVIEDICSYSNKNEIVKEPTLEEISPEFRQMYTEIENTFVDNEERFIDQVHNDFTKKQIRRLRKNKHKLIKVDNIEANIRKSKDTAFISNEVPQFDRVLFNTSNNFTKIDNLTIAEIYDLQKGFAPQAGPSYTSVESECSGSVSSTCDATFMLRSSKIQSILDSSTDADCSKSTLMPQKYKIVNNQLNLDSSKSSFNDILPPNRPRNEAKRIHCAQTSMFSYTITFQEDNIPSQNFPEAKSDLASELKNAFIDENCDDDTSFDNSAFVHDFSTNLIEQSFTEVSNENQLKSTLGKSIFDVQENVISQQGIQISLEKISEIKTSLEKSILEEEIAIVSASKSPIATNFTLAQYSSKDSTRVILSPKYLPPTIKDVKLKLNYYNIPEHRFLTPFYSDYSDVTSKIDVGLKMLQIPSNTTADLDEFITSSGFCGLNTWRRNKFKQLYPNMDISKTNLRLFFAGNAALIMEPAKLPPSRKSALTWIRTKMERQDQKTEKKLEKIKIHIPMSPGNDNGELDATLTLTPCTPQSLKLPDFIDGTPKSSQEQSPSLLRRSKLKGQGNLQRKALFTVQALSESSMSVQQLSNPSDSRKIINQNMSTCLTSNNSFQITGVTLNNTHDFKMSYENLQHARAVTEVQNLSILVLELHIRTRTDLYPDPQYDAIRAIFYSILNDVSQDSKLPREETGVLVVDSLIGSPKPQTQSLLDGSGVDCIITYVKSELELVDAVVKLIRKWDPDIFAGYEIEMLSWGYLIERSSVIGINLIPQLSRLNPALIKPKQNLREPQKELKLRGRIILDIWRLLKHEIALQSYTFENMMYHVLHRRVPAHSFKSLTLWWEFRTNIYRHITANYYVTRVEGVLKLLDQLDLINRTCELARLFGIQFYEVLSRGSQFRVESMMLRLAKPLNYIATSPSMEQRAQMRAPEWIPLIFEPESRLYTDPIIVLDFQSLYPSIIIAYNYCYSTCVGRVSNLGSNHPFEFGAAQLKVPRETLRQLNGNINFSPCGVGFVNADVREGILPRMLKEILETRLMVKASMKQNQQNKLLQRVLHSRQLGLKLIANVTYGYTSANFSGRMPCIEVGDSVVSKGRETLERAVKLIEDTPKWGAKVVYGDTDSLFVLVQGRSRAEAFKIGADIAEAVTNDNPPPIKLKLEKIYQPCILQTKKRYVGYMYESPDQTEPEYNAKGIETVRRDGCPAVAKMLEKSLRILFDTQDVSLVKRYVVRQFDKLLTGRASIQDLIFAREYRGSGGYRPGACVPALELSKRWFSSDKRREPRRGERVPYIIVNGPPGFPLIRLVRCPRELLADPATLRPNAVYYITRVIAPPLNRCLSLIGVDVQTWYCEMPRKQLQSLPTAIHQENCKKSTISQYFATMSCAVCEDQTRTSLCDKCVENPQQTVVVLQSKINCWERLYDGVNQICQSCCGRKEYTECTSLDCPVLYRAKQMQRDLKQVPFVRNLLSTF